MAGRLTRQLLVLLVCASSRPAAVRAQDWRTPGGQRTAAPARRLEESLDAFRGRHVLIRIAEAGTARVTLADAGVQLLEHLGDGAWFATVSREAPPARAALDVRGVTDIRAIDPRWKLHPILADHGPPPWAVLPPTAEAALTPRMALHVVLHRDVTLPDGAAALVTRHGGNIVDVLQAINGLVVELPVAALAALAAEDAVQWIEPPLPALGAVLDSVRALTAARVVQAPPYGLDGAGVTVLVYDVAQIAGDHPDFGDRVTVGPSDTNGPFLHATHVAGIIGGSGLQSCGRWRGMAPAVQFLSYGFKSDATGTPLYTNPGDLEDDYAEAVSLGAQLSNNSIGTNLCANGMADPQVWDCEFTGDYGVTSAVVDAMINAAASSPLRVVWAAGNERGCERCVDAGGADLDGFHSTVPPSCAKNPLVVGAVNSNDASMTPFSSWGPCDDGRLKPEVVAPGCQTDDDGGVSSTIDGGGYWAVCGTSMAAPVVTGLEALMLQDYFQQHPGLLEPTNALLKAAIVHNAADWGVEEGYAGPDYMSGYGLVRFQETIDFLRSGDFQQFTITQGQTLSQNIAVQPGHTALKATLAWDDWPGPLNIETALVNDLDVVVISPGGAMHYPWTLQPDDPSAPAQRAQPDHLNNLEQVVVDAPETGNWQVRVLGTTVPQGPQRFSLCISALPSPIDDCDGSGVSDAAEIADGSHADCNANAVPDLCDIASEISHDCQPDGVPDDCQPDCNLNGQADTCDITLGSSPDCNGNFIPDECDIAAAGPELEVLLDPPLAVPAGQAAVHTLALPRRGVVGPPELVLDIRQRQASDLRVRLAHGPASAIVFDACPADGADLQETVLRDDAATGICAAQPPYAGSFQPSEPLGAFEGLQAEGDWTLLISGIGDSGCGLLRGWRLSLGLPAADCNDNGVPDSCDLDSGELHDDNANDIPDECEPTCPTVLGSVPAAGAIDARWPHEPADSAARLGWSAFDITVEGSAKGLSLAHFTIGQEGGDATPPTITDVLPLDADTARVVLSGPIAPGAWTTLTHTCSGAEVRVGFLPADVNGDGTAAALDILALVDHLNGAHTLPLQATDINRSGHAEPLDILALIDLLNGASAFEAWNGRSLP